MPRPWRHLWCACAPAAPPACRSPSRSASAPAASTGCRALAGDPGTFVLERGTASYRVGSDEIRFGPGAAPHHYVQVHGAEPRLPGHRVYVTGFTPFDHTLVFECG